MLFSNRLFNILFALIVGLSTVPSAIAMTKGGIPIGLYSIKGKPKGKPKREKSKKKLKQDERRKKHASGGNGQTQENGKKDEPKVKPWKKLRGDDVESTQVNGSKSPAKDESSDDTESSLKAGWEKENASGSIIKRKKQDSSFWITATKWIGGGLGTALFTVVAYEFYKSYRAKSKIDGAKPELIK